MKIITDDLCGKVPNLCAHICENTNESYRCKCFSNFKLDDNGVTCTALKDATTDIFDEDSDKSSEDYNNDFKCEIGFTKDLNDKCVDIDECILKIANCDSFQYCHNTIGSYRCLNIESKSCEEGFNFNMQRGKCEGKLDFYEINCK